jgi:hypothetical protein
MLAEVYFLVKGFPILTTLIGLLPSVNSLMHSEVQLLVKGFSTLITLIGLSTSVTHFMY